MTTADKETLELLQGADTEHLKAVRMFLQLVINAESCPLHDRKLSSEQIQTIRDNLETLDTYIKQREKEGDDRAANETH